MIFIVSEEAFFSKFSCEFCSKCSCVGFPFTYHRAHSLGDLAFSSALFVPVIFCPGSSFLNVFCTTMACVTQISNRIILIVQIICFIIISPQLTCKLNIHSVMSPDSQTSYLPISFQLFKTVCGILLLLNNQTLWY